MARNETKSVIFSSEKRKNERVMIEFAILKDKLTMSRCCSLYPQLPNKLSPLLDAIARMVPIVWKTRGDPKNHLERGRLICFACGWTSGVNVGASILKVSRFLRKGRALCEIPRSGCGVKLVLRVSLLPISCSQGQNLGNKVDWPSGWCTNLQGTEFSVNKITVQ